MDHCCEGKTDELLKLKENQANILKIVMAINLIMFGVEFVSGWFAQSTALMADSLDMLGDSIVYGFSLYVLHRSMKWKAVAALLKGVIIVLFAVTVLVQVIAKIMNPSLPVSETMGIVGALALAANGTCLFLLYKYKDDDLNMKSTWICSRNDIISNVGVLIAATLVAVTQNKWPDIIIGFGMAVLFFRSAIPILLEAIRDIKSSD